MTVFASIQALCQFNFRLSPAFTDEPDSYKWQQRLFHLLVSHINLTYLAYPTQKLPFYMLMQCSLKHSEHFLTFYHLYHLNVNTLPHPTTNSFCMQKI